MIRRTLVAATLLLAASAAGASATTLSLYRSAGCSCCEGYVDYLRDNGYRVRDTVTSDMAALKREQQVPNDLGACHTAVVAGYTIEGHVPVAAVRELLRDRPEISGIAVPGMPRGVPGMPGSAEAPIKVWTFAAGQRGEVFGTYSVPAQ